MKRTLALLIIVTLLMSLHPTVTAETVLSDDGLITYSYSENIDGIAINALSTSEYIGGVAYSESTYIYIPSSIDGLSVTEISPTGRSIIDIDGWPSHFRNTTLVIPSTVHTIGNNAFADTNEYNIGIVLPDSVKKIGSFAFSFAADIEDLPYYDDALYDINLSNVEYLDDYALYNCNIFTNINNLDNLKHLGTFALGFETELKSIKLPLSLEYIGDNPFIACYKLTTIEIDRDHPLLAYNNGVLFEKPTKRIITYLPSLAANEYKIPDGITAIGNSAFVGCYNLTTVGIPDSVTTIGHLAFAYCQNLNDIIIPSSVTTIGDGAFAECNNLSSLYIPTSITSIGSLAFPTNCILIVEPDSYAHEYAVENGYAYQLNGGNSDMDWLD